MTKRHARRHRTEGPLFNRFEWITAQCGKHERRRYFMDGFAAASNILARRR
jgi:hypothetical protein